MRYAMPNVERLSPTEAMAAAHMTFPAYRHLLSSQPARRHLDEPLGPLVRGVAVGARGDDGLIGLAVLEVPDTVGETPAALLSVFVDEAHRRRGVATALLREAQRLVAAQGAPWIEAVYMTGGPFADAVERLLARERWSTPTLRAVTMRATLDQLRQMPWFGKVRLPASLTIFPWTELTAADRRQLATSQQQHPWIVEGLEPWRHDHNGFDEVSSLGLRDGDGAVVGWVINHRLGAGIVRFSGAFARDDHARRGRIFALYTESVERLRGTDCRGITCITPARYRAHASFLRDRCAPCASFFAETRGAIKALTAA
jgi:GNAT superfamily N-acetyltransferase